ncbi:family 43 glycosylhydrolase [Evansella sp. AB-rgal1]|uniref:family 43 glycosylhydrolase n=1 Tax=Evansella sp. AB-rgal1 TaxID=3242696 RepID=UPI00359ECB40
MRENTNNTHGGDLGNGMYVNPILRGNYADPSIVRVGEDYYMVNTSYQYVPGLIVWHSKDLINWTPIGTALENYNGNVWAPDIAYHNGTFYIYFPADKTNWVTKAEDPKGPWSKPINLQTSHIDPGHVVGPDGKRYLHLSGGNMVQLSDDGLSTVGEVQHVYEPWSYPENWVVEAFSPEGPKLTFHNDYYYLTIAVGGTAGPPTSHMVATSRSKTPWGPWEHSPYNPIIKTNSREEKWWSQGHGTLVDTPNGDWFMVYHAYENSFHTLGRQVLLVPIEWTEDGWFKVSDNIQPDQPIKKPEGSKSEHGLPTVDRFESNQLGIHWQTYGNRDENRYEVGNSELTIKGINGETISPLLYMTGHPKYEVEVEVSVSDDAEGQLLLYYDNTAYFGLGVSKNGVRHFRTFKNYRTENYEADSISLKIKNDENIISFYYKEENGNWVKYDKVIDASGFHHNTFGGFLSLRVGIETVGNGIAKFKNFHYKPLN